MDGLEVPSCSFQSGIAEDILAELVEVVYLTQAGIQKAGGHFIVITELAAVTQRDVFIQAVSNRLVSDEQEQ